MSKTLILSSADKMDPEKAISGLNSQIVRHGQGANLAAFLCHFGSFEAYLDYVNAGFNPPFIVDPGGMVDTLGGSGLALGMLGSR